MKFLSENIKEIEQTIESFSEKELTYADTYTTLIGYGYSKKEVQVILENVLGKTNGTGS
tara:strand:- start:6342 stop:6518 length:177 start_codon:yes stop_codon:yes gene_type:complete